MEINSTHPQYNDSIVNWTKIEDITRLKNLSRYLMELNPIDKSKENVTRNEQYRKRAIFYAVAAQTTQGMVGTIFRRWPVVNLPVELEYLTKNADGAGQSIYQSSQGACDDVIRKGRAGIYVTFPKTEGEVKRADILAGKYVATIHRFAAEEIINWRIEHAGARVYLALVITREREEMTARLGYNTEYVHIYRELYLDYLRDEEGNQVGERKVFHERIWREDSNKLLAVLSTHIPTDANGMYWEEIPFSFIGSENNDSDVDVPPMLPLVELNVGHYRNSADYEDSVWFVGQAQPYMTGLSQDYIDMLKANNMYVGSRNLLGVPSGETFGFAQAQPNTLVREAMQDKIVAMVQLGARLMQSGSATKTATQAESDKEAQTSMLALVASNVSEAYTKALEWCARYMGANPEGATYTIAQDFVSPSASPQMLQQMVAGFLSGAITPAAMLQWQKDNELEDNEKSLEMWQAELDRDVSTQSVGSSTNNTAVYVEEDEDDMDDSEDDAEMGQQ